MTVDPREPMTVEEVEELLRATLHGPLPQTTVWRMMATLAEWRQLPAQLEAARAENTLLRSELALRPASICLGCGKREPDCKCTDEEIEYNKRLEREQKAE